MNGALERAGAAVPEHAASPCRARQPTAPVRRPACRGPPRPSTAAGRAATARASPRRAAAAAPVVSSPTTSSSSATRRQEQVDKAITEARSSGMTPEQVLLQSQAITSDQLARATSERFGLDHLDLNAFEIDLGAMNLIPSQAARRYGAIPVAFVGDETLLVAMSDPTNVRAVDDISIMTGLDVRPAVASAEDIDAAVSNATKLDSSIAEAIEEDEEEGLAAGEITEIRESAGDAPVIKLVNGVIAQGHRGGRLRHPLRAGGQGHAGALPRGRHPPRRHHRPAPDGRRRHLAPEDHGEPRHRREAPPAGRPRRPERRRATRSTSAWPRCPR